MLCPMKIVNSTMQGETLAKKCEKEECAWWDKNQEECAVLILGWSNNYISGRVVDLIELLMEKQDKGAGGKSKDGG